MSSSEPKQQIPIIDFSGISISNHGNKLWNEVATQAFQALQSYGCFQASHQHSFTVDLRSKMLSSMRDELFSLPLETKLNNTSEKPFHGYVGPSPELDSESLAIMNPTSPEGVPNFVNQIWPHTGNPNFCERVKEWSSKAAELEAIVRRMVVEGLGVKEEHALQLAESTWYFLRFWEYGKKAAAKKEKGTGYIAHRDSTLLAFVGQLNDVNGLEVQSRNGDWIVATPSPSSLIVIAGDSLRAWSNGRIYAPLHRIMASESLRYSTVFFSIPKDEFMIEAPEELVDDQHPRLFKPFTHLDYLRVLASEFMKTSCRLTAHFLA